MQNRTAKGKKKTKSATLMNRREFIKSMGISSVGLAAVEGDGLVGKLKAAGVVPSERILGPDHFPARFVVNEQELVTEIEPWTILVDVLRDQLHLTGTKIGCNRGACGACTVILNGKIINSCLVLAVDCMDLPIQTVEGLSDDLEKMHPLQSAFIEHDALQCGFCTSGMIMSCKNLLDHTAQPSDQEIRTAVSGNLCRCATYPNVFKAVKSVVKK